MLGRENYDRVKIKPARNKNYYSQANKVTPELPEMVECGFENEQLLKKRHSGPPEWLLDYYEESTLLSYLIGRSIHSNVLQEQIKYNKNFQPRKLTSSIKYCNNVSFIM